jgi:hypothetical protein
LRCSASVTGVRDFRRIRTSSGIRRAVNDVNPAIPIITVETQMSQIERRFAQEKVLAQAYTLFSGIAIFVAAIGLFGLMSYNGVAAALASGRYVATQLYGLAPNDLATIVAATGLLLAVSAAAGYLPARRAARVDPMVALRYE